MYSIKYDFLNQPLELKKTHDFCAEDEPALTVVLIHGIASDSGCFYNTLRYLEGTKSLSRVRFVTFDLLGAGKSYKSDKLDYDYDDMLEALDNSLTKLKITTPLILVGHSMGTLIVTRYAFKHKKAVKKLILASPPVYTEENLADPAFELAMDAFKKAVSVKKREILAEKSFNNEIKLIVKDRKNYKTLAELTTPAVLIYGDIDQIIAPFNIKKIVKENPEYLKVIKTVGRHGMSHEKYVKIKEILEEALNETV